MKSVRQQPEFSLFHHQRLSVTMKVVSCQLSLYTSIRLRVYSHTSISVRLSLYTVFLLGKCYHQCAN